MRLNLAKLVGKHAFQNFDSAIAAIGPRPWLMDNLDEWLKRMRGPPHRLVNEINTYNKRRLRTMCAQYSNGQNILQMCRHLH